MKILHHIFVDRFLILQQGERVPKMVLVDSPECVDLPCFGSIWYYVMIYRLEIKGEDDQWHCKIFNTKKNYVMQPSCWLI